MCIFTLISLLPPYHKHLSRAYTVNGNSYYIVVTCTCPPLLDTSPIFSVVSVHLRPFKVVIFFIFLLLTCTCFPATY